MELLLTILLLLVISEMSTRRIGPSICRICDKGIRWSRSQWVHSATGAHWAPYPKLEAMDAYALQPDLPQHPATPVSTEVYFR